jgi:hypothetical protein
MLSPNYLRCRSNGLYNLRLQFLLNVSSSNPRVTFSRALSRGSWWHHRVSISTIPGSPSSSGTQFYIFRFRCSGHQPLPAFLHTFRYLYIFGKACLLCRQKAAYLMSCNRYSVGQRPKSWCNAKRTSRYPQVSNNL